MKRALIVAGLIIFAVVGLLEAQTTGINDREIQRFVIPGTANLTGWRVHASAIAAHMSLVIPRGTIVAAGGYKTMLHFAHNEQTVPALTNNAMPLAGSARGGDAGAGVNYQRMPFGGSIMGLAIGTSAAVTAGRITARATVLRIGNVVYATGLTALLDAGQYQVNQQERGIDTFTSGEGIGCQLTTSADYAPATSETVCTVVVEF